MKREVVTFRRYIAPDAKRPGRAEPCVEFRYRSVGGFLSREKDLSEVGNGSVEEGIARVVRRLSRLNPAQIFAMIVMGDVCWIYDMPEENERH